jgi:hypothetical protein
MRSPYPLENAAEIDWSVKLTGLPVDEIATLLFPSDQINSETLEPRRRREMAP